LSLPRLKPSEPSNRNCTQCALATVGSTSAHAWLAHSQHKRTRSTVTTSALQASVMHSCALRIRTSSLAATRADPNAYRTCFRCSVTMPFTREMIFAALIGSISAAAIPAPMVLCAADENPMDIPFGNYMSDDVGCCCSKDGQCCKSDCITTFETGGTPCPSPSPSPVPSPSPSPGQLESTYSYEEKCDGVCGTCSNAEDGCIKCFSEEHQHCMHEKQPKPIDGCPEVDPCQCCGN